MAIPRKPECRIVFDVLLVGLYTDKIRIRIDLVQLAGLYRAEQDISDPNAILRFKEIRVLSIEHCLLNHSLSRAIRQRNSGHA